MGKLMEALRQGKVLVSDGAWGTFLYEKGLKPGDCPEVWSLERPRDVEDIARAYARAGADLVQANSFGANRLKLEHFGLGDKAGAINEAAARASRAGAGDKIVAASMGPTGKMLLMGDVTEEEMYEAFREQAVALECGGADAVCIETMSDAEEAAIAVRAVKENTALDVAATFTFERTVQGDYKTMMGLEPGDAAEAVLEEGADLVGANCGNGMERMIEVVRAIRSAQPQARILVHSNAGLPQQVDGRDVYTETPEFMAALVGEMAEAGACVIGGCCGTTPAHIAAFRAAVDAL